MTLSHNACIVTENDLRQTFPVKSELEMCRSMRISNPEPDFLFHPNITYGSICHRYALEKYFRFRVNRKYKYPTSGNVKTRPSVTLGHIACLVTENRPQTAVSGQTGSGNALVTVDFDSSNRFPTRPSYKRVNLPTFHRQKSTSSYG